MELNPSSDSDGHSTSVLYHWYYVITSVAVCIPIYIL